MLTQAMETIEQMSADSYQLIRDEKLEAVVISSQILAGSKILFSTYSQVVFRIARSMPVIFKELPLKIAFLKIAALNFLT